MKHLFALLLLLTLSGCDLPSSENARLAFIEKTYHTKDIYWSDAQNQGSYYIVRLPDNSVLLIERSSDQPETLTVRQIFSAKTPL
jgi:hypothetical protein